MYSVIYFGLGGVSVAPLVVRSFCVWLHMCVCLCLYLAVFSSFFSHIALCTFFFFLLLVYLFLCLPPPWREEDQRLALLFYNPRVQL